MADRTLDLNIGASAERLVTPALRQRIESIALGTATIALLLVDGPRPVATMSRPERFPCF